MCSNVMCYEYVCVCLDAGESAVSVCLCILLFEMSLVSVYEMSVVSVCLCILLFEMNAVSVCLCVLLFEMSAASVCLPLYCITEG